MEQAREQVGVGLPFIDAEAQDGSICGLVKMLELTASSAST
jgi:hypothetical protein